MYTFLRKVIGKGEIMEDKYYKQFKIFGENVRKVRLEKGITLKELSEKTKISEKYLNRIEEGNARRLSTYHLYIISQGLRVLPHVLCENI